MCHIQDAFDEVCTEAVMAEGAYVVLMERVPYYGGPEEGGWWGSDTHIRAYQYFPTLAQAEAARMQVEKLAQLLSADARHSYGQQCLREVEWCDARGLDADYPREPDGESSFYVLVSSELPMESRGTRQYS